MKKDTVFIHSLYILLLISGSAYGIGEKTLVLGGESGWKAAEYRQGVAEVTFIRPHPVLTISTAGSDAAGYSAAAGVSGNFNAMSEPAFDLSISFDEKTAGGFKDSAGNYSVAVSPDIEAVDRRFARAGNGAALFSSANVTVLAGSGAAAGPLVIEPVSRDALFAAGNHIMDFTVEFWLYPLNLENGEQILSWISTKTVNGKYSAQKIVCATSKNRLQWTFSNFFAPADGSNFNIIITGDSHVVPKAWSHHLLRFDATTGMIEYLVDGHSEAIVYAAKSGREGGEVYTPAAGSGGVFIIGERFMGLIDELKIHKVCAGRSSFQKYTPSGGRMETNAVDLGNVNTSVLRIDVSGGRKSVKGKRIDNEFRENGRFRFSDDSEMQFFIRAGDHPYRLNEKNWIVFTPGADIIDDIRGRYVQIAVDFYPSSDGETSPYLDELRVVFLPDEAPLPPGNLTAVAIDGAVLLKWKPSPDRKAEGYLVYYSSVRDELFGEGALSGPSPIDVGKNVSFFVDGLNNGTLYYFRVAAYDFSEEAEPNVGEFSREVTARPLKGLMP